MSSEYLYWRGNRIRVTQCGEGEPLLLISGLGCSADMWTPFVQRFANRHVIRFDAPGTGQSSTPVYPISVASLADLAAAVLDHHEIERADVVGFSYGGAVAQQFAYGHPRRIRRLVLAATTCGIGAVPGAVQAIAVLANTLRFYSPTYFERVAPALYGGVTGRDAGARARGMQTRTGNPPSSYGYAMQLLGATGWTSLPFLADISHETLVISGDDDPLVPVANAHLLATRIPRARVHIVERAGHLFLWDDAANLAPPIAEFIDG